MANLKPARNGVNWTPDETAIALALYLRIPPSKYAPSSPEVQQLARTLQRTPKSVKAKLENLKRNDPARIAAGQSGLPHGAKAEETVWERYFAEGDGFVAKIDTLLTQALDHNSNPIDFSTGSFSESSNMPEGKSAMRLVAHRVNSRYFRNVVSENYENCCCITGIGTPELLIASHIKPWAISDPKTERLNAHNGLYLNALHDKAFDRGLITIDKDLRVVLSSELKKHQSAPNYKWICECEGQTIRRAKDYPPDPAFIEYHNDVVFVG